MGDIIVILILVVITAWIILYKFLYYLELFF